MHDIDQATINDKSTNSMKIKRESDQFQPLREKESEKLPEAPGDGVGVLPAILTTKARIHLFFFFYYHYRANNTNQAIIHDESTNQFNENQKKMEAKQKKNERSQPERGLAGVKSCVYGSLFC